MTPYTLFLIEPTDQFEVRNRRIRFSTPELPAVSAQLVTGQVTVPDSPYNGTGRPATPEERAAGPWPTHAPCGYAFTAADEWYVNTERLYRLPDGTLATLPQCPPGACYEAPMDREAYAHLYCTASVEYEQQHAGRRGMYHVRLPDGHWFSPDSMSRSGLGNDTGSGWTVTGTLPLITVNPSIDTGAYHGFIGMAGVQPGQMTRDIEGRPY